MQEIIREFKEHDIQVKRQYYGANDEEATYKIIFGGVTVNKLPRQHESDGLYHLIFPHEARVRGLTY